MTEKGTFFDLYRHGFVRAGFAVPHVRVAHPEFNAGETIRLIAQAGHRGASLVAFPELGLTAYSCEDLFHQQALLQGALAGLERIVQASREHALLAIVGIPLRIDGSLYNCA